MHPDAPDEPVVRRGLVPQALLDPDAVFVVKRLQRNGQQAYLVGGCVRDLLAGLEPKDFDVATDAHPPRIKRLFSSARIIGRRFRLVHVRFPGNHVVETATFRGDPERIAEEAEAAGDSFADHVEYHGAENLFGTAPEDARRRDFTINALFYDPVEDEVIDWVGGLADLEQGVVRSIGDPGRRIAEDPVRMIRAVHFAQRLDFAIEPTLEAAIAEQADRIAQASQARLYVELQKIVGRGRARATLHRLWELRVLAAWIPELSEFLDRPMAWPELQGGTHAEASHGEPADLPAAHATWNLLGAADRWGLMAQGAPESLSLAVLFGPWLLESWRRRGGEGYPAFDLHFDATFRPVSLRMSIPRWASARMRDVLWMLLELREGPGMRRRSRIFQRPGFAEALALLEMDLAARDCAPALLEEWRALAEEHGVGTRPAPPDVARAETLETLEPRGRGRRGGRRRGGDRDGSYGGSVGSGGYGDRPERGGFQAEAAAWDPPPDTAFPPGAPSLLETPSPVRPPAAPVPPVPPVPPVLPAKASVPAPRPNPPAPRPALGDDDFAAGLA